MALSDVVPCDFCDEALNLTFCNDCFVRLCNECKTKHSGISLCKNLVPYKERKLNCTRVCNVHRKDESNILCKTCTLPICSSCLGRHKDHALIVGNELSTRRGKCLETLQYQFEEMKLMEKSSNFTFELCGDSAKEIEKTLKDLLENDDQDNPVFAFELAGRNETECLRRENTQLSKENERLTKEMEATQSTVQRLEKEREELEDHIQPAGYEHEDLHKIMKRLKQEISALKNLHRSWEKTTKRPKLDHDFREHVEHVYTYASMIATRVGVATVRKEMTESYENEIAKLKDDIRELRRSNYNDKRLQDKDFEIQRLKREVETLRSEIRLKRQSDSDQGPVPEYENRRHSRGRLPKKDENGAPDTSKYIIHDLKDKTEKLTKENEKLKQEKSDLEKLLEDTIYDNKELTETASQSMQSKNPNITDLSDPNRPLKIAEKYSELYDNQWTNAMENLEGLGVDKEKGIKILLDIITAIYKKCQSYEREQLAQIEGLLYNPLFSSGKTKECVNGELGGMSNEVLQLVQDSRKQLSDKTVKVLNEKIQEEISKDLLNSVQLTACSEYIQCCVQYCWLMVIQNPPIYMHWDFRNGISTFDKDVLKSYTKCGNTVAFMVWPVLYLHKDGPLLCKGVAQGTNHVISNESEV